MPDFFEFFAGGGMVRAGLGPNWTCRFANDVDPKKADSYIANWGPGNLVVDDIRNVAPEDLTATADLMWGSFPCQDLSVAGGGAGLKGGRSGTFFPFMSLVKELKSLSRAPALIALENVVGTLTSHNGADFTAICRALQSLGYRYGALVVDAARFVPQSRPRLFVIALRKDIAIRAPLAAPEPNPQWHTNALRRAFSGLPRALKSSWIWWDMPIPAGPVQKFDAIIEDAPRSVAWHSKAETTTLLSMMSEVNLAKVETARKAGRRMVGSIYKRTRVEHGIKVQRAEIRFDDIAGCLRTPAGGSSRQLIMVVDGPRIMSRLISTRETARLMGLPDTYKLPEKYNQAYHLTGDGVAVPVVRHIAAHLFEPLLETTGAQRDHKTGHCRDPLHGK